MTDFSIAANVITYTILIAALSTEGSMQDAEDIFQTMIQKGGNPDIFTYNAMMDGYCLHGQMDKERVVFETMHSRSIGPHILSYSILMNGYFKNNEMIRLCISSEKFQKEV